MICFWTTFCSSFAQRAFAEYDTHFNVLWEVFYDKAADSALVATCLRNFFSYFVKFFFHNILGGNNGLILAMRRMINSAS